MKNVTTIESTMSKTTRTFFGDIVMGLKEAGEALKEANANFDKYFDDRTEAIIASDIKSEKARKALVINNDMCAKSEFKLRNQKLRAKGARAAKAAKAVKRAALKSQLEVAECRVATLKLAIA